MPYVVPLRHSYAVMITTDLTPVLARQPTTPTAANDDYDYGDEDYTHYSCNTHNNDFPRWRAPAAGRNHWEGGRRWCCKGAERYH